MNYLSTRGDATARKFCDILLEGLAPDGGLYLPQHYPQLDAAALARLRQVWRDEGYAALAFEILSLYIDDIPRRRPAAAVRQNLHARSVWHARHHAVQKAGRRLLFRSPVQRPHARVQRYGYAAAGQLV